jgi:hypothetical protein
MSENALRNGDLRGSLVEACRPESGNVGVGWGRKWGRAVLTISRTLLLIVGLLIALVIKAQSASLEDHLP